MCRLSGVRRAEVVDVVGNVVATMRSAADRATSRRALAIAPRRAAERCQSRVERRRGQEVSFRRAQLMTLQDASFQIETRWQREHDGSFNDLSTYEALLSR